MFLWLALAVAGQMVEKIDPSAYQPPDSIPAGAKEKISAKGFQFLGEDKAPLARLWPLPEIHGSAEPEQIANGITLAEIETGQTLGWLEILKPLRDFRAREIPQGTYLLRLVTQPSSDDHNDTAPGPYFAMVLPGADPDWKETQPLEKLFKAGTKILDKHPPILLLHPGGKIQDKDPDIYPKIVTLEKNWKALAWKETVKTPNQTTTLEFRLVISGHSPAVKNP